MNAKTAALVDALAHAQMSQIIACLSAPANERYAIIDRMDKPTLEALEAICKEELDKRRINK